MTKNPKELFLQKKKNFSQKIISQDTYTQFIYRPFAYIFKLDHASEQTGRRNNPFYHFKLIFK